MPLNLPPSGLAPDLSTAGEHSLSVSTLLLSAKRLQIDAARRLAQRVELVGQIGQLIHVLQKERGASSIYLASAGQRFGPVREQAVLEARQAEQLLREGFARQLPAQQGASARMLDLMAWALLGLEGLTELRDRIQARQTTSHQAVTAFSQLIGGLLELIVEVADAALLPAISRLLVALLHLVQGSELAGQERAVGAELFASGRCDEGWQLQLQHLIDAQERSLQVFEQFAQGELLERWEALQQAPELIRLERLRRTLCSARAASSLDSRQSDAWFDTCSQRIGALRGLQEALVLQLRLECEAQVQQAERELQDSEGLLQRLRQGPPRHGDAVARFFDPQLPAQPVPTLTREPASAGLAAALPGAMDPATSPEPGAGTGAGDTALLELLQQQSARLAEVEAELEATRRTLSERKVIDRAKALLMSRMGMSEEQAFRALQKTSMDQNRRLVEVAQATLALPDFAFAPLAGTGVDGDSSRRPR